MYWIIRTHDVQAMKAVCSSSHVSALLKMSQFNDAMTETLRPLANLKSASSDMIRVGHVL